MADLEEKSLLKAFVTGWPVAHSRSPIIHNFWLKEFGVSGYYQKRACNPTDFSRFLTNFKEEGFVGGNVTIPHKEAAFEFVDKRTGRAERLGAVNTVWLEDGVLWGDNTDGYGFLANLDQQASGWDGPKSESAKKSVLILGAGGASRAIVDAMAQRGFDEIIIANRTVSRAEHLAETVPGRGKAISLDQAIDAANRVQLVINTTSLGMDGDTSQLPLDMSRLNPGTIVTDIVYVPLETPFLNAAQDHGLKTVDGLGMLLHQAVPGFERWFGQKPKVTVELRNLVLEDLARPHVQPRFLGLTGSIGMGKSTTAQMFRDLGIPVHDSDATVHLLYQGRAVPLVEAAFPGVSKNGEIDRQALSQYVVGNDAAMKKLEAIVHPLVAEEERNFREQVAMNGDELAILDAPLLFEQGNDRAVDGIIVVTAPADVQKQRVMSRPNMTEKKFENLLARQVPDADKRAKADHIIDTSLGMDSAREAVVNVVQKYRHPNDGAG